MRRATAFRLTANELGYDHLRDTIQLSDIKSSAEEEGFEPPELALGGFQNRCLRPLGHSSIKQEAGVFIGIDFAL